MRALDRKLLRNLRQIWAQTLAIALVLGCGVMVFVGSDSTQRTLSATQEAYYDRQRFADIWAGATRMPRSLLGQIALIDGVAQVDGRSAFPPSWTSRGWRNPPVHASSPSRKAVLA